MLRLLPVTDTDVDSDMVTGGISNLLNTWLEQYLHSCSIFNMLTIDNGDSNDFDSLMML